jgi:LysM repeat protein
MASPDSKSFGSKNTGPGGGSLQAPNRTAPSTGNAPSSPVGGGGGGGGGGNKPSGGATSKPSGAAAAPGGSAAAAKANAAKAAPAAKAPAKPTGGSGIIGSKGGGASVQKPGAGVGPARAGQTNTLKAFTAGSNLAADRAQQMNKVGVGQGFIKSQTQSLKDQYSQYRSPPGIQAPKAPTAGRGTTTPTAPPKAPGIRPGQASPPKNFGSPAKQPGITQPKQSSPPKNFASPGKPTGPTVQAGTSWTNPNGVPENVRKALEAKGFAPDGSRLPTQSLVNRGPLDPGMKGKLEEANRNYTTPTGPFGTVGSPVYNRPDLGPKPPAPAPKVQTPAQNASYFGDLRTPIGTQLGYQIGSVVDDYVTGPIRNAFTRTPVTPSVPADPSLAGRLQAMNRPVQPAAPVNNASYFGDLRTPIGTQLGYQAGSVFNDYVTGPIKSGLSGLVDTFTGTPAPAQMKYSQPIGPQKPAATPGQLRAINTPAYGVDPSMPGRLQALNAPSIPAPMNMRPGFTADNPSALDGVYRGPVAPAGPPPASISRFAGPLQPAPGFTTGVPGWTADNPMTPPSGLGYSDDFNGPLTGMQPFSPNIGQVISQDPISYGGPRAGTTPPSAFGAPRVSDNFAGVEGISERALTGSLLQGFGPTPKVEDRVIQPQGAGMPAPTGQESVGPTAPQRPASPAGVQNSYTVKRGDTLSKIAAKNGTTVKAIAEANGIANPNKIKPGQTLSIPTNASVQPTGGSFEEGDGGFPTPGDGLDGVDVVPSVTRDERALMRGEVRRSPVDNSSIMPSVSSDERAMMNRGPFASSMPQNQTVAQDDGDSGSESVSPSQEYDGGPDENFTQYDGQPQDLGELRNRVEHERYQLRQGFRDLPSRIGQAIRDGDFRGFQYRGDQGQGGRGWERTQGQNSYQPFTPPTTDINTLVAQLLALLEQQQGGILSGPSQMDLVNRTFI